MDIEQLSQRFMRLYQGSTRAYGTYEMRELNSDTGKREGVAMTVKKELTKETWKDHLLGDKGLGVIPITDTVDLKNVVTWGAGDIDIYPLDLPELAQRIAAAKLPFVVCRSKSGGAHIYLFITSWCPAKAVKDFISRSMAFLGYAGAEVWPKQATVLADKGDYGNWINMPYFDAARTIRYGFNDEGKALDVEEFVDFAESKRVDPTVLDGSKLLAGDEVSDGPPCLQHLCQHGFPSGTRNNGLMAMGVYFKKKFPDTWQTELRKFNTEHPRIGGPMPENEVVDMIRSLSRKEYNYRCKEVPIKQHCNAKLCAARKFGIGENTEESLKITALSKLLTTPPIWFVSVDNKDKRLQLTTEQLHRQEAFQKVCMEQLNYMPPTMKRERWVAVLNSLLMEATMVEVPFEATQEGLTLGLVEEFVTNKASAKRKEQITEGKPWSDGKYHYFKLSDMKRFLLKKDMKIELNSLYALLKEHCKCETHFFNIKNERGIRCHRIPYFPTEPLTGPPEPEEVEAEKPVADYAN